MVSPKQILSTVEASLHGPTPPTPSQRMELMLAIRRSLPSLQSLVSYPLPKPADRTQVQSKEVRLPDSSSISLDDQDVEIILEMRR
ncbi:nuclear pore complex protein NUP205-like isoform X2 [Diospyros lotus]|uniref:nuclear pore complex protein NUP205-like isoform X2 n=1 Tax=Diospyros lotus TaxID=55363 RepID=UPI00224F692A|nr:nuclear pore complex protein NUP205-like isoform X2 [Diospyros lotus]